MAIVNEFYDGVVSELSEEVLDTYFMSPIKEFIAEKMDASLGKLLSADPLTIDESDSLLDKAFEDEAFKKEFLLKRIHNFGATCKIKHASNKWIVDYFYLSCLEELLASKEVERVKKNGEFTQFVLDTQQMADEWLEKMTIPVEKGFFKKLKKTDEAEGVEQLNEAEVYASIKNITKRVFITYHSINAGLEKERDDVAYAYELIVDSVSYDDIEEDVKKDAVKSAKIQKDQEAMNLFENLLMLYYIIIN